MSLDDRAEYPTWTTSEVELIELARKRRIRLTLREFQMFLDPSLKFTHLDGLIKPDDPTFSTLFHSVCIHLPLP
jgi:hypothetical protein